MWEVHYSREAATYLEDNAALITGLFFAIESLAGSDGTPRVGDFYKVEGVTYWSTQGHLVAFRRIGELHIIRTLFIKPE